jgi:hypothetical protein
MEQVYFKIVNNPMPAPGSAPLDMGIGYNSFAFPPYLALAFGSDTPETSSNNG